MSKTAMTEWFDELKANYPYMANEIYQKGFEKYLEKEKEQIEYAFKYALKMRFGSESQVNTGEEYYNQTYNQNKETNNLCQLTSIVQDVVIAKEDLTIS